MIEIKNIEQIQHHPFTVREELYSITYDRSTKCIDTIGDTGASWVDCYIFNIRKKDKVLPKFEHIGYLKLHRNPDRYSTEHGRMVCMEFVPMTAEVAKQYNIQMTRGGVWIDSLELFTQHLVWIFENYIVLPPKPNLNPQIQIAFTPQHKLQSVNHWDDDTD